jgi:hypothetical protein
MLRRLWHRLFGRPVVWQRSIVELGDLERLARTGLAEMLLGQEKARLDFLGAREAFEGDPCRATQDRMEACLARLQATNAVVQSLLNEQQVEQRLSDTPPAEIGVGKSR